MRNYLGYCCLFSSWIIPKESLPTLKGEMENMAIFNKGRAGHAPYLSHNPLTRWPTKAYLGNAYPFKFFIFNIY